MTAILRTLIKNLEGKLDKNDPRWLAFGLNMPATVTTPGQPQNVTAAMDDAGAIVVQCDAVPLATRYRWRILFVGVQSDYELAASSVDPIATIRSVLPGKTVQLIVQAVNEKLQGVASEPIVLTVPTGKAARAAETKAAAVAVAENVEAGTSGDGHRNGNGNGNGLHARAA